MSGGGTPPPERLKHSLDKLQTADTFNTRPARDSQPMPSNIRDSATVQCLKVAHASMHQAAANFRERGQQKMADWSSEIADTILAAYHTEDPAPLPIAQTQRTPVQTAPKPAAAPRPPAKPAPPTQPPPAPKPAAPPAEPTPPVKPPPPPPAPEDPAK